MRTLAIIVTAVLIGLLIYFMVRQPPETWTSQSSAEASDQLPPSVVTDADGGTDGQAAYFGPTVAISMIYSPEKDDWIRQAASEFVRIHPAYQISLTKMSSFEAAAEILDGTLRPTVWSPASTMVVRWFEAEWRARQTADGVQIVSSLIANEEDELESLVRSPLTMMAWESSLTGDNIANKPWQDISFAMAGLLIIDISQEGVLHLGHTNPSRSNSGLQALYMLALSYYRYTILELKEEHLDDPKLVEYLRQWETQVSDFPRDTTELTSNMFRFGPSRYRLIMTYENLALERRIQSWNVPGPFGKLLVGYPGITMWSEHPVLLLKQDPTDEQADIKARAADEWIKFLRSPKMQQKAVEHGFRPVTISFDVNDPDSILYRVPGDSELQALTPPSGEVIRKLLTVWHSFQAGQTQLKVGSSGRFDPSKH